MCTPSSSAAADEIRFTLSGQNTMISTLQKPYKPFFFAQLSSFLRKEESAYSFIPYRSYSGLPKSGMTPFSAIWMTPRRAPQW